MPLGSLRKSRASFDSSSTANQAAHVALCSTTCPRDGSAARHRESGRSRARPVPLSRHPPPLKTRFAAVPVRVPARQLVVPVAVLLAEPPAAVPGAESDRCRLASPGSAPLQPASIVLPVVAKMLADQATTYIHAIYGRVTRSPRREM